MIHVRVITSERFCCGIADEIDDCVVDTIEYDHIKGHDLNRLSMKEVNKRFQDLPRGITLAVKCRQRTIKNYIVKNSSLSFWCNCYNLGFSKIIFDNIIRLTNQYCKI